MLQFRGRRQVLVLLIGLVGILLVHSVYLRIAAQVAKQNCQDQLKRLGLALHNYEAHFGTLPPAYVKGKDGRPAHSWRVLLLPFLGRQDLYDAYDFNEPWDGPNNARLIDRMPDVFACPADRGRPTGRTSYVAVVGSQTAWPGDRAVTLEQLTAADGSATTILLIEIADSDISWTEPRDVLLAEMIPPDEEGVGARYSSAHAGVVTVLFGDGSVRRFRKPIQSRRHRQEFFSMLTAWHGRPFAGEWLPGEQPVLVGEFPPEMDASQLHTTDITPHLEDRVTAERNYVYCATFQLAWDDLRKQIGAVPQVEGNPALAAALNRTTFPRSGLSPESYVARIGLVRHGIREAIVNEMARKFPEVTPSLGAFTDPTDLIVYSFLQKYLPFEVRFDVLPEPLVFHASTGDIPVKSFGFKELQSASGSIPMLKGQVDVLHYVSDDEFVIRLKPKKDEIVLAKVRPSATLAETLHAVQKQIREQVGKVDRPTLEDKDTLLIPRLAFNVLRNYDELVRRLLQNSGWEDKSFAEARQSVRFLLNESGARMESEVVVLVPAINGDPPAPPPPPKPRRFVPDRPFLLYLKERTAEQPYAVIWVANGEIMEVSR